MKEVYERPRIMVEEFSVNRAIAACMPDQTIEFDCMIGTATDTTNVITEGDGCTRQAATTSYTKIRTSNSHGHSEHSGGSWSGSSGTITYTAPSWATGLIYYCTAGGTSCFDVDNTNETIVHNSSHSNVREYHVEVLPTLGDVVVAS